MIELEYPCLNTPMQAVNRKIGISGSTRSGLGSDRKTAGFAQAGQFQEISCAGFF